MSLVPNKRKKYMWTTRDFEECLRQLSEQIKKEMDIYVPPSDLTYFLAKNLREGKINIDLKPLVEFKNAKRKKRKRV